MQYMARPSSSYPCNEEDTNTANVFGYGMF